MNNSVQLVDISRGAVFEIDLSAFQEEEPVLPMQMTSVAASPN